jgi:hypothetical protein
LVTLRNLVAVDHRKAEREEDITNHPQIAETMEQDIENTIYGGTSGIDEGIPWIDAWVGQLPLDIDEGEDKETMNIRRWNIVFGHDARRGLQQTDFATGLDTGCAYGKQLSALILPQREIIQVDALEVYSPVSEKES